jgi:hypothetical protein
MAENQEQKIEKEPLPVDEAIQVIDYETIYKTQKWWCAVLLGNMFGHDKIMVYLWQMTEVKRKDPSSGQWVSTGQSQWKRKQKMGINFEKDWEHIKKAVDSFMPRIRTATG